MRKFKVIRQEVYRTYEDVTVEIEAKDEIAAVLLVEQGYGDAIEWFQQNSEFLNYRSPRDEWEVEEVK